MTSSGVVQSTRLWAPQATLGSNRSGHNVIQDTERNVSQKRAIKAYLEIQNDIFDSILVWSIPYKTFTLKKQFLRSWWIHRLAFTLLNCTN